MLRNLAHHYPTARKCLFLVQFLVIEFRLKSCLLDCRNWVEQWITFQMYPPPASTLNRDDPTNKHLLRLLMHLLELSDVLTSIKYQNQAWTLDNFCVPLPLRSHIRKVWLVEPEEYTSGSLPYSPTGAPYLLPCSDMKLALGHGRIPRKFSSSIFPNLPSRLFLNDNNEPQPFPTTEYIDLGMGPPKMQRPRR